MNETYSPRRKFILALSSVSVGVIALLFVAELLLSPLPLSEHTPVAALNDSARVLRYTPHQSVTWSRGSDFSIVNHFRINNDGFVSDIDYEPDSDTPLLAVIGDSFVEAKMVPSANTIRSRLHDLTGLPREKRVYSFAMSGAALAQYLAWAEYAKTTYAASFMIFVIVQNDFDESLELYKPNEPGLHFQENRDGKLSVTQTDYNPSILKQIIKSTNIGAYLFNNIAVGVRLRRAFGRMEEADAPLGDGPSGGSKKVQDSRKAIVAFFDYLPVMSGLDEHHILFVLDGMRPELYSPSALEPAQDTYWSMMRNSFMEEAGKRNYTVIDMQQHFIEDYNSRGMRFEYPTDPHWNADAHELVAKTVAQSEFFARFVQSGSRRAVDDR